MSSSTDPAPAAAESSNSGQEPPSQGAQSAASPLHHLMFLPKDQWSPRYEETFYSVKIEGFQRLFAAPATADAAAGSSTETVAALPAGKPSFPAYYYQVVIYRGHQKKTVLRRYSQFKWLYNQLVAYRPPPSAASATSPATPSPFPSMPPGTCPWDRQDDAFAAVRQDELADFLTSVLERPGGYTNHEAVVAFLELV